MKNFNITATLFLFLTIFCQFISGMNVSRFSDADSIKSKISFSFGMDLVTRYVWRGDELGINGDGNSTSHFQPNASLTYNLRNAGALVLGFWGSYGFNGAYSENDYFLSYSLPTSAGNFLFMFTDYCFPDQGIAITNFEGQGNGAHTIEALVGYTLPGSFPVSINLSTNIHNDAPGNKSFYGEINFPFTLADTDFSFFAGAALGKSYWHNISTDKVEFNNVGFKGSKSIKISQEYSLPVSIYWIYNPHQKKTFLVFKLSL